MNLTRAAIVFLALGLGACQSQKPCCSGAPDDEPNNGNEPERPTGVRVTNISEIAGAWTLVALGTERVGEIRAAHPSVELGITFSSDGGASGQSGVNRFSTKLDLASKELLFTPVLSTKMAGPADLMQLEGAFHNALSRTREIEFRGDLLALSAYGSTLATFRRVK